MGYGSFTVLGHRSGFGCIRNKHPPPGFAGLRFEATADPLGYAPRAFTKFLYSAGLSRHASRKTTFVFALMLFTGLNVQPVN